MKQYFTIAAEAYQSAPFRRKGYAEPFKAAPRPTWLIELSLDSKTRRLVDFAVERAFLK